MMKTAIRVLGMLWFTIIIGCVSSSAAKVSDIGENESFTLWCDDAPCAWKTEAGKVESASTWHTKAHGLKFIGDPSRISQVVELDEIETISLTVLGDIDKGCTLSFQVDFCNDGLDTEDFDAEIPDGNWKEVSLKTEVPSECDAARIILEKRGSNQAVLAEIELVGTRRD